MSDQVCAAVLGSRSSVLVARIAVPTSAIPERVARPRSLWIRYSNRHDCMDLWVCGVDNGSGKSRSAYVSIPYIYGTVVMDPSQSPRASSQKEPLNAGRSWRGRPASPICATRRRAGVEGQGIQLAGLAAIGTAIMARQTTHKDVPHRDDYLPIRQRQHTHRRCGETIDRSWALWKQRVT